MEIQLAMVVLEVQDMNASIAFYRKLGLNIPEPVDSRPLTVHRMSSGVSLLLTTSFASQYDTGFQRPTTGYQQMLEFYVGDDDDVQTIWSDLVAAGYVGRLPPTQTTGPFAAMIEDPDGNVILLTSDEAAQPGQSLAPRHSATVWGAS